VTQAKNGKKKPTAHGNGVTTRGYKDRLTGEQRMRICQLIAEFSEPAHICETIASEFQIPPPHPQLIAFYSRTEKWKAVIDDLREKMMSGLLDISIANKAFRLRVMEQELKRARQDYLTGYAKSDDGQVEIYKRYFGSITELLRLAALEMGDLTEQVHHDSKPVVHEHRIVYVEGADLPNPAHMGHAQTPPWSTRAAEADSPAQSKGPGGRSGSKVGKNNGNGRSSS
jgi:hypothetical protein